MVRALDNPDMLAHDLPFGNNNDPVRVYPQAHPLVRKRCRHAITVTVKVHEAGRGYPLAVFDKAVEDTALRHQAGDFLGMHISQGARQATVLDMPPLRNAMFLQPGVQGIDIGEAGPRGTKGLPQPPPRILHVARQSG